MSEMGQVNCATADRVAGEVALAGFTSPERNCIQSKIASFKEHVLLPFGDQVIIFTTFTIAV